MNALVSAQKEGALADSQHKARFLTLVRNDKRCCHFDRREKSGNYRSNFSKKGGTREWHLDKEILEKNARNKIRVHQCLPIVEKILEKPK